MRRATNIILILELILTTVGLSSCDKANSGVNHETIDKDSLESNRWNVGGPCGYRQESVTITVKRIKMNLEQNNKSSNRDSEDVIIEYDLSFDDGIRKGEVINESLVVTSQKIKAKGIKVGKKYRASINLLVSGTCNPGPYYPGFEDWR